MLTGAHDLKESVPAVSFRNHEDLTGREQNLLPTDMVSIIHDIQCLKDDIQALKSNLLLQYPDRRVVEERGINLPSTIDLEGVEMKATSASREAIEARTDVNQVRSDVEELHDMLREVREVADSESEKF
jgi:hypothetical protein